MMTDTHAARMDAIYARQRYIYNVTRKYYLLGRDRLIRELDVPRGGTVLEIGCGTGRNLIKVARRYPSARLYGLDISEAMLATARAAVTRASLADRIVLQHGDATSFNPQALFGAPQFDCVYFSYTLSMIPDWQAALMMAARTVAPDATLRIVDFGQQDRLPVRFKSALFAWLQKFDVMPVANLREAFGTASESIGARCMVVNRNRGYTVTAMLHRAKVTM